MPKKKRCKITLTDSLNQKLDDYADPDISDIYTPQKDKVVNYADLLGDDVFYAELTTKSNVKTNKSLYIILSAVFVVVCGILIIVYAS